MIGAQQEVDLPLWFAWHDDGALAARITTTPPLAKVFPGTKRSIPAAERRFTQRPAIARDPSGLPTTLDGQVLTYSANHRLSAITERGRIEALYKHNAWGQRIRTKTAAHTTDYLYLGNRRVAEARRAAEAVWRDEIPAITRRYLYAHDVPVGMIVYPPKKGRGELYAIHADLLGAPRMVTDANARLRWLANYTPLGEAERIAGDLTLDLRLPGQWYDHETGLHDNLLRTYAPQWGQYLEPDPLGPLPGSQALGYAAQQPRRFVDPLGLMLFAFDGTRNDERTNSNVRKFMQYYPDDLVYYQHGPGIPEMPTPDAALAYTAPLLLEEQWQRLLTALKQNNTKQEMGGAKPRPVSIDLVGFSRGAALARHFGNMILAQTHEGLFSYQDDTLGLINACVDFRFMGLFDTVAQFGAGFQDGNYNLTVAEPWRWVAHAVALHDFRGWFPLTSVQASNNTNVIEAPFIGAHSDIGGGDDLNADGTLIPRRGDLSDVALNWLLWQAQSAGIKVKPLTEEDRHVQYPLINTWLDLNRPASEPPRDRPARDAQGGLLNGREGHRYQGDSPNLGNAQRRSILPLLRAEPRQGTYALMHTVDMAGYREWLKQELGWDAQFTY